MDEVHQEILRMVREMLEASERRIISSLTASFDRIENSTCCLAMGGAASSSSTSAWSDVCCVSEVPPPASSNPDSTLVVAIDVEELATRTPARCSMEGPSRESTELRSASAPATAPTTPRTTVDITPVLAATAAIDGTLHGEAMSGVASTDTTDSMYCPLRQPVIAPVLATSWPPIPNEYVLHTDSVHVAAVPLAITGEFSVVLTPTNKVTVHRPMPWPSFMGAHADGDETRPLPWPSFKEIDDCESPNDALMKPSRQCSFGNLFTSTGCIIINHMCNSSELRCLDEMLLFLKCWSLTRDCVQSVHATFVLPLCSVTTFKWVTVRSIELICMSDEKASQWCSYDSSSAKSYTATVFKILDFYVLLCNEDVAVSRRHEFQPWTPPLEVEHQGEVFKSIPWPSFSNWEDVELAFSRLSLQILYWELSTRALMMECLCAECMHLLDRLWSLINAREQCQFNHVDPDHEQCSFPLPGFCFHMFDSLEALLGLVAIRIFTTCYNCQYLLHRAVSGVHLKVNVSTLNWFLSGLDSCCLAFSSKWHGTSKLSLLVLVQWLLLEHVPMLDIQLLRWINIVVFSGCNTYLSESIITGLKQLTRDGILLFLQDGCVDITKCDTTTCFRYYMMVVSNRALINTKLLQQSDDIQLQLWPQYILYPEDDLFFFAAPTIRAFNYAPSVSIILAHWYLHNHTLLATMQLTNSTKYRLLAGKWRTRFLGVRLVRAVFLAVVLPEHHCMEILQFGQLPGGAWKLKSTNACWSALSIPVKELQGAYVSARLQWGNIVSVLTCELIHLGKLCPNWEFAHYAVGRPALLVLIQSAVLKNMELWWFTTALLTETVSMFSTGISLQLDVGCSVQSTLLFTREYQPSILAPAMFSFAWGNVDCISIPRTTRCVLQATSSELLAFIQGGRHMPCLNRRKLLRLPWDPGGAPPAWGQAEFQGGRGVRDSSYTSTWAGTWAVVMGLATPQQAVTRGQDYKYAEHGTGNGIQLDHDGKPALSLVLLASLIPISCFFFLDPHLLELVSRELVS